jgi:DNA-binding MarR family transcriptional regulator
MPSVDDLVAAWRREFPELDWRILQPLLQASQLAAVMESFHEQVLEPFEIGIGEYELLSALRRAGSPYRSSPSALAVALNCSSGGVTKRLGKLEAEGFIKRSSDPEDGRGSLASLSQRGLDLQERIFKTFMTASQNRLSRIEVGGLEEIAASLRRLGEALEG